MGALARLAALCFGRRQQLDETVAMSEQSNEGPMIGDLIAGWLLSGA
jgi:hypothetical protein